MPCRMAGLDAAPLKGRQQQQREVRLVQRAVLWLCPTTTEEGRGRGEAEVEVVLLLPFAPPFPDTTAGQPRIPVMTGLVTAPALVCCEAAFTVVALVPLPPPPEPAEAVAVAPAATPFVRKAAEEDEDVDDTEAGGARGGGAKMSPPEFTLMKWGCSREMGMPPPLP